MTMQANSMTVLAVGGYEKEHLLDQLFLRITEYYLAGANVVVSGPFPSDMSPAGVIQPYGPLLESREFDAIWTVGGGIGGCHLEYAFRRSVTAESYQAYERLPRRDRQLALTRAAGHHARIVSPYIPAPTAYSLNVGTVSVINSAGIDRILDDSVTRYDRINLLRGITFLSVRDKESSDILTSLGIGHDLAPDPVHTLATLCPASRDRYSDIATVWILAESLAKMNPRDVAEAMSRCSNLRRLKIRVLQTGNANGEISAVSSLGRVCPLNEELVANLREYLPHHDIQTVEITDPYDLVNQIRESGILIGDEQHSRIIADAYGVPRLTISTPFSSKAAKYHSYWDQWMPYEVALADLDPAISRALSTADNPRVLKRGRELSERAHAHLTDLVDEVRVLAAAQSVGDRQTRGHYRRALSPGQLVDVESGVVDHSG